MTPVFDESFAAYLAASLRSAGAEADVGLTWRPGGGAAYISVVGDTMTVALNTAVGQPSDLEALRDYTARSVMLTVRAAADEPQGYQETLAFIFRLARMSSGRAMLPCPPFDVFPPSPKRPKRLFPDDIFCSGCEADAGREAVADREAVESRGRLSRTAAALPETAHDGRRPPEFSALRVIGEIRRLKESGFSSAPVLRRLDSLCGGDILTLTVPRLLGVYNDTGDGFIGGLAVRLAGLSDHVSVKGSLSDPALRAAAEALAADYSDRCRELIAASRGIVRGTARGIVRGTARGTVSGAADDILIAAMATLRGIYRALGGPIPGRDGGILPV